MAIFNDYHKDLQTFCKTDIGSLRDRNEDD